MKARNRTHPIFIAAILFLVLSATAACDLLLWDKDKGPEYIYGPFSVVRIDSIRIVPSQANFFITCGTPDPAWSYHSHTFTEKNDTVEVTVTGKRDRAVIAPTVIGMIPVELRYAASSPGPRTFRFNAFWDLKWIDTTIVLP